MSSYAIKEDGTLWSWGDNTYGQLGYGNLNASYTPVQVGTANDWKYISAGPYTVLGLKTDGTLWAWGKNNLGEIGDGTYVNRIAPVQIGTDQWLSVCISGLSSTGVKANHTLWGWGYNGFGQLTDQLGGNDNVPSQIGSASDWQSVAAGGNHSVMTKLDGSLFGCGYNLYGQLGDGTNVDKAILTIVDCTNLSDIPFVFQKSSIIVSPNPATDRIDFSEKVKSISIFDLNGRMVKSSVINGMSLPVTELSSGVYILQYETDNELLQTKLIKE